MHASVHESAACFDAVGTTSHASKGARQNEKQRRDKRFACIQGRETKYEAVDRREDHGAARYVAKAKNSPPSIDTPVCGIWEKLVLRG